MINVNITGPTGPQGESGSNAFDIGKWKMSVGSSVVYKKKLKLKLKNQ